jgi:pyruvate/2-oxoglutarate dehydrogenase complex dihydrolipoamide dehydrogenase (E3) component
MNDEYDLVVIGAGPAGEVVASFALTLQGSPSR